LWTEAERAECPREVHVGRRKRRKFTEEFKAETVRLVGDSGESICKIARDLDLTESALRGGWNRQRSKRAANPGEH
jgi:transposase-like protein